MARILLSHGCSATKPKVSPSNWNTVKANIKKEWFIFYRFFDPAISLKGKLVIVRGMNIFHNLHERQQVTAGYLANEINALVNENYNPITKTRIDPLPENEYGISPKTPMLKALDAALKSITVEETTRRDIKSVLKYFGKAARDLHYDELSISEVSRRHIRAILGRCGETKKIWNENQFNVYRKYLMVLFEELMELEAVTGDPVSKIKKKKTLTKIRETLSDKERVLVDQHLKNNNPAFWRFMHIFFHSGARIKELLDLKREHVDLENQRYKATIRKGKSAKEVWKPIKDIAMGFWIEQMALCGPEQFVFGKFLVPGDVRTTPPQITRRWDVHVKKKLGIKKNFYSLKHLNTTEMVDLLNVEDAAKLNSHTSTAMVVSIYDTKNKARQDERIKKAANKFA